MDIKENKHGLKGNSKNGKKYTCYKVSYHLLSKISIPWGPLYNNQLPLASPSRNSPRYTCTQVVVVQLLSHIWLFGTPWTAARQAPLSSTVFWSLLRFMSTESVMLSNHLILRLPAYTPIENKWIKVFPNRINRVSNLSKNCQELTVSSSAFPFILFKIFHVDHFLSLYLICYNIASVFCLCILALRHVGS